jgi:hypothetical protein
VCDAQALLPGATHRLASNNRTGRLALFHRLMAMSPTTTHHPCDAMTKYANTSTRDEICRLIATGMPVSHAAAMAGIGQSTLHEWRNRFPEFAEAILAAEAKHVKKQLTRIDRASAKTWQAAAWQLERRYPQHFGRTFAPPEPKEEAEAQITIVEVVPPQLGAGGAVVDGEYRDVPDNVRDLRPD